MAGNFYHGEGKVVNAKYTEQGLYRNGVFAHGMINFKDGRHYTGSLENGLKNGYGVFKNIDGSSYEGFFLNDKFHGKGKLNSADGSSYDGNYFNGEEHGSGVMVKITNRQK